jgi:SAM-dependent methyltransferase
LDIGCGGGRHTFLLAELGYPVDAIDISVEGLRHVADALAESGLHAKLSTASMTALPFPNESFAIAVSYGVFYYGTAADGLSAVAELHRVLRVGGRAFIVVRSTDDSRCGRGVALEAQTYCVDYDDTNERGTTQHFLSADEVEEQYGIFRKLSFELTETTFRARTGKNSDWLITVGK